MITIDGTDYMQPSDMSVVSYSGGNYVLVSTGDTIQRVLMSEVLEAGGVSKYPFANGWDLPLNFRVHLDGYLFLGPAFLTPPYLYLNEGADAVYIKAGLLCNIEGIQINLKGHNSVAGYSVVIQNDSGAPTRRAVADTWAIYPSFATGKDDLMPIVEPIEKVVGTRGYTYEQEGIPRVGFTIEDIESANPAALERDDKDGIIGYDPNALLATAYEAIRLQEQAIEELLVRVQNLENQK